MNDETRRQNAKQEYLAELHRLDAYVRKAADNLPELMAQNNISRVKSTAKRLEIVNGFLSDETLLYLDSPIRKEDIAQLQDENGFIRGVVEVNEDELPNADDAAFDMLAERLYGHLLLADTSFSFVAAQGGKLFFKVEGHPDSECQSTGEDS